MAETIEMAVEVEKLILLSVKLQEDDDIEESLNELAELVRTAGGETVGKVIQNREKVHPGTYIGKGKIEEVKELLWKLGATGVVCDDELTPAQQRNLEAELDTKVMDRTLVILDIFANRALTKEGKIQVELAQLKYRSSRLVGLHSSLSKLGGGGIGTRGPGEKRIEIDRRLIKDRIVQLNRELEDVKSHREVNRQQRSKNCSAVVSIVGYTNSGKSTLLNKLTDAGVLSEDKLFATLDATTRNLILPSKEQILITDTVGFIRKLPHNLIDAFRGTLEEAKYSDIIVHVVDSSSADMDKQMGIVYETLSNLGVSEKPIITLFNKCDKLENKPIFTDPKADITLEGSAMTGEGLDKLKDIIDELLREKKIYIERCYPFSEAAKIQKIRKYGQLISEEYTEIGIEVKAFVPKEIYSEV